MNTTLFSHSEPAPSPSLESLWRKDGAWRLSPLVLEILHDARQLYPRPTERGDAPWPSDARSIGQNLAYLLPGHMVKITKVHCRLLGDTESLDHIRRTDRLTVLDLACGPAMASVATVDFLHQILESGVLSRETPLTVSFLLNDLKPACVQAAQRILSSAPESPPIPLCDTGESRRARRSASSVWAVSATGA